MNPSSHLPHLSGRFSTAQTNQSKLPAKWKLNLFGCLACTALGPALALQHIFWPMRTNHAVSCPFCAEKSATLCHKKSATGQSGHLYAFVCMYLNATRCLPWEASSAISRNWEINRFVEIRSLKNSFNLWERCTSHAGVESWMGQLRFQINWTELLIDGEMQIQYGTFIRCGYRIWNDMVIPPVYLLRIQ